MRLDEVVLRALEKEPELRYQQASQVKTAVETIASGAGAGAATFAPTPPPNAEALMQDILARAYTLSIRSCLRRGWALVRSNFWPIVGISALIWVLLAIAHSAGIVVTSGHDRTQWWRIDSRPAREWTAHGRAVFVFPPKDSRSAGDDRDGLRGIQQSLSASFPRQFRELAADRAGISLPDSAGHLSVGRVDLYLAADHGQTSRLLVGDGTEPQDGHPPLVEAVWLRSHPGAAACGGLPGLLSWDSLSPRPLQRRH